MRQVVVPFIGRGDLLVKLDALASERLVTLVGPGGVGKTRLAERWAQTQSRSTFFVDLDQAESLADVERCLATVLGLDLGERDALLPLTGAVDARGAIQLILDNAERVLPA